MVCPLCKYALIYIDFHILPLRSLGLFVFILASVFGALA